MNLTGLPLSVEQAAAAATDADPARREQILRELGKEFEAVLTAALLKDSLKGGSRLDAEDGEQEGSQYMDFAYEQMAQFIGRQGVLGLADSLTAHLRVAAEEGSHGS